MKKSRIYLHKSYIVLGIVIFYIISLALLPYSVFRQLQVEHVVEGSEIVVVFNEEVGDDALISLADSFGTSVEVVRHIGDYALFAVKDISQYNMVLESFRNNPLVKAAQENYEVSSLSFSNDTYSETQWAINNPGHYIYISEEGRQKRTSVEGIDMDVLEAWKSLEETEPKQREVIVAIIDTGVDYSHPDLAEHMWLNEGEIDGDNLDNDNNGYVDDIYGWDFYNDDASVCHYNYSEEDNINLATLEDNDDHGTHVAGIIAAVGNNNIGVAGVASNIKIKIMSLKINGGPKGTGSVSASIEAIKYATMMGADICNLSWGTAQHTDTLKQIMKESDMLFVAAAGNSGTNNNNKPIFPASLKLDNLISVTFIDSLGKLTNRSNYGTNSVDLAAPGEDIFSTVVGSYRSMSGSSMATPQVSAVAAILYGYGDHLYPVNVKEIILNNIKVLPTLDGFMKNAGIPSAYQAVMASKDLISDIDPPELTFETIYQDGEMIVPVYAEDIGFSEVRVVKWILGDKKAWDFKRGITGTTVEDNQINIAKAGKYTFYAADYAGNETIQTYQVLEDTTAPRVISTYSVANSYKSRTVSLKISDMQSGIKRVKYLAGKKKATDFLPAGVGTEIELNDGKGAFKVKKDGTYTIFASDKRGNMIVKQMVIKTVKTTAIKFTRSQKLIYLGDQYTLRAFVKPIDYTDKILYSSSNERVATVTSSGKIEALKEGKTRITAKTSSGLTAICEILIKNKK